ncbi:MAG TPA: MerR family transcriptional regulator [Candidatus Acidoferrales bacterium]|nr:MerR family transcriptional regulator [Candidatus Acidoferrales bacterium]
MKSRLTIGKLAEAAGVGVETIRFYQRSGLLPEPERPPSGYREYAEEDARRIRFIKRAQTLGFSLADIAGLLKLDGPQTCSVTHDLALEKLHVVEEKITALTAIQDALQQLARQCELKHKRGTCPIIQSLAQDGDQ